MLKRLVSVCLVVLLFSSNLPFISHVKAEEKEPEDSGNILTDGTFDVPAENYGNSENVSNGWNIHNQGDYEQWAGKAAFTVVDGKLNVEVQQVGWEWWHIQLFQEAAIPAGKYSLQFDMSSEIERPVYVELVGVAMKEVAVDQNEQTYNVEFDVAADDSYKFLFGFGRASSDQQLETPYKLTLDNVKLIKVEEPTEDPVEEPSPGEEEPGDDPITIPDIEEDPLAENWDLVWEESFSGSKLDTSKWNYDTGNGYVGADGTYVSGWGNEELEYYQKENVSVEDGKLVIEAKKEQVSDTRGTYDFTSGKITTKGKFSQKYGKFEAKIKLPQGQGYWPAFWMMPQNDVYGGWAASGEIDIMEAAGGDIKAAGGAIHYGSQWPNNTYTAKDYHFLEGKDITDFNVYSVEWEPGEIRWYVNGELFQTLNNWSSTGAGNATKYAYPAPFDQEFYLILNLAVGGWYGGNPDQTTEFPGKMEVEYVRVYEKDEYREPVEPSFEAEELPEGTKAAIDGNYVYDRQFNEGFTSITNGADLTTKWNRNYWNLVYMDEFNGNGTASVEQIGDERFAKVDVLNGGNQPYSVQLIQNVTLGKGRWYKLNFDAKSSTNRTMNVKVGGGPDRGYTAYSPSRDFELTNEVKNYELMFQMQHDTDLAARLEMNLGLNTNPVWIGNVVLEEVEAQDPYNQDAPKAPLKNGNHVYNGTFDQGSMDRLTFWNVVTDSADATALVDEVERKLTVNINNGASDAAAVMVVQKGMNLLANDEYKLTFNAAAEADRVINVAFLSEDGTVTYFENEVALTTAMGKKEFSFTMPNSTDTAGQLVFMVGGSEHDVFLDDVSLTRLTNNNVGLTFDDIFPLKNGDFSNGLTKWSRHVQGDYDGPSSATLEEENGAAKVTVTNVGINPWDVQLFQSGLSLKQGETYVVEFDAKSSVDRKLEVVVDNGAPSYQRFFNEIVELSNTYETYQFEFTMSQDDVTNLQFLLGNVDNQGVSGAHEVMVDNVRFEVKNEGKKFFPLQNGHFSDGLTKWSKHVQGDYDGPSSATLVEEDGAAKVTVDNVGINPWDVQLFQSGLALTKGETYIVEFDAKSSLARKLEVVVDNGAPSYQRFFNQIVDLTDAFETYQFEFTMTHDDVTNLLLLLGNVDNQGITGTHDVIFDNVKFEVKGAREALSGGKQDEPGDGTEEPGDGTEEPGDGTEEPGDGTEEPGDGTEEPGDGTEEPGDGTEEPGDGTEEPGDGSKQPNDDTKAPGTSKDEQDTQKRDNQLPDTATSMYNILLLGILLLAIGVTIFYRRSRI